MQSYNPQSEDPSSSEKYAMRNSRTAKILLLVVTLSMLVCIEVRAEKRPNIVFFLVDDLGQRDVACYGSQFYETPSIDALAKDGLLFENAYATCHVCSPSRASILTGKYPARTNLTEWLGGRPERAYEKLHHAEKLTSLPDEEQTLAETLHKHGYATANYGKAHLSKDPTTYGFDEAITGWVRSYYHPFSPTYEKTLAAEEGDYFTDKLTDAAIDFIERNKDKPFFVHLEHFSVHDPIQGRKDLVHKYQKKLATMPPQEGPDYILEVNPDGPAISSQKLKALEKFDDGESHQNERVWWVKQKQDNIEFAGMVEATDESLGRIRAKLKELGLEENTIIVFTADNGGMAASNQYRGINSPPEMLDSRFASSNLPLRGAKGWNYEGGIRVPLIVHWPGKTKPNSTSQAIVTGTDFYPTLLEMLELPALPDQHQDGRSFVPALKAQDYDRGAIYWHFPHYSNHGFQSPGGAIRVGRYKLLEYYENGTLQLFDLENDIGERNDLVESHPEIAERLKKMLHDWRDEVDAKMPYPKTATSKPAPGARVAKPKNVSDVPNKRLPADVEKFAPGWKVKNWGGPALKPGLRQNWQGRSNVLLTHPQSKDVSCILSRSVEVPAGKKTILRFAVNNHPKGDWILVVRVDGEDVLNESIDGSSWQEFSFDLTKYAGTTINLELENRASGWSFEAAYWHQIELVSK
jgi:arylsulfatase A-like enzyme